MKKHPNLALGLVVFVLLALGALQGRHIDRLRESERFYRWILSACTQYRLSGFVGTGPDAYVDDEDSELMDEQLFQSIIEAGDTYLEDIDLRGEMDLNEQGSPLPRVVRYTSPSLAEEQGETIDALDTAQQRKRDRVLWNRLACNPQLASLRAEFHQYLREERLAGLGSQFSLDTMYGGDESAVSLGNMFFGFRKMAANFIWLEVDKYWHEGQIQRMIPLMNTCVALDPNFIDAYLVGAWHLSYNITAKMDETPWASREFNPRHKVWVGPREQFFYNGIDFLSDGTLKNPRNYKLYFDMGYAIYEAKLEDRPNAVKYLREANHLWHDIWVPRTLYRVMGYNEQYEKAKAGWERYAANPKHADLISATETAPRFIRINQGLIYERDARQAQAKAKAAAELARRRREQGLLQQAADYEETAQKAAAESERLFSLAHSTQKELYDETGDVYAMSRVARIEAADLVRKGQYYEAIAKLQKARFDSNRFFWEGLDLILDVKRQGGIPPSRSEQSYMRRKELSAKYTALTPKAINGINFFFEDDSWHQEDYKEDAVDLIALPSDSDEWLELQVDHPEVARYDELPGPVVFSVGDVWYRYEKEVPDDLMRPEPRNAKRG